MATNYGLANINCLCGIYSNFQLYFSYIVAAKALIHAFLEPLVVVVLRFNAILMAKVISWRLVTHMFLGFLTQVHNLLPDNKNFRLAQTETNCR